SDQLAAEAAPSGSRCAGIRVVEEVDHEVPHRKRRSRHRRGGVAIALEAPNGLIGKGQVAIWLSINPNGHVAKVQVGLPLFTCDELGQSPHTHAGNNNYTQRLSDA